MDLNIGNLFHMSYKHRDVHEHGHGHGLGQWDGHNSLTTSRAAGQVEKLLDPYIRWEAFFRNYPWFSAMRTWKLKKQIIKFE
jgi:hypothetical protein